MWISLCDYKPFPGQCALCNFEIIHLPPPPPPSHPWPLPLHHLIFHLSPLHPTSLPWVPHCHSQLTGKSHEQFIYFVCKIDCQLSLSAGLGRGFCMTDKIDFFFFFFFCKVMDRRKGGKICTSVGLNVSRYV